MRVQGWLSLMAAVVIPIFNAHAQTINEPPASPTQPAVSSSVAEVVKMAEAGTSEEVLLAYVQNSSGLFDLSADQILYLRDIGLPSSVISGMLNRDGVLKNQSQAADTATEVATTTSAVSAEPVALSATTPAIAQAPAPVYVSSPPETVSYFYNDLAPYGTWVQLDGVGWCWQPRVVVLNHAWRPYCDSGHWVYTDAGWLWQSDYSWGWAPFHYGRWFLREGCGWVWTPDRTWGPAWVTWRYDGDHCGWAPLPPHADFDLHLGYCFNGVHVGFDFDFGLRPEHFTFISLHDFDHHDYAHHCLPPTQVTRIYNHTTVINNYVVNNHTIVNRGIQVDRVAAATHSEIHRLPIRDVPAWSPAIGRPGINRTELAVYRPQLRPPVRPANMIAQKIDEHHPTIQHVSLVSPGSLRPSARPASPALETPEFSARSERQANQITRTATSTGTAAPVRTQNSTTWAEHSQRPSLVSPVVGSGNRTAQQPAARTRPNGNSGSIVGSRPAIGASVYSETESPVRPGPDISHANRSSRSGSYNPFNAHHLRNTETVPTRLATSSAGDYARKPNYQSTESRVVQQSSSPASTASLGAHSHQAQIQWPAASHPVVGTYSQAPRYSQPNQAPRPQVPAAPAARTLKSAAWENSRANHALALPNQYAQRSPQLSWAGHSYGPAQDFRATSPRAYPQSPAMHPQPSANSRSSQAYPQPHTTQVPQAGSSQRGHGIY